MSAKENIKKDNFNIKNQFPIIAIGSSSGGPKVLNEILPVFPVDLQAALVIVQHMPAGFTKTLAKRLDQKANINIKEAEVGDKLKIGQCLIAPGNYHLEIENQGKVKLLKKPPKWGVRPCVDYMLSSIAKLYKEKVIGVILTGMGHDGAEGMQEIKKHNGYGLVQDKKSALVYGMASATIKANAYDEIVPLEKIPYRLMELIAKM